MSNNSSVSATISALNSSVRSRPPRISKAERRANYLMRGGSNDRSRTTRNVYFFKAGDKYFDGVRLPVNSRRYRTMDALLDELSVKIPGLQYGARGLFTAKGQRRVKSLDNLEHMGSYVASDQVKRTKVPPVQPKHSNGFIEFQRRRDERIAAMRERTISNMAMSMISQVKKQPIKKSSKRKKGAAKRSKSLGIPQDGSPSRALGEAMSKTAAFATSPLNSATDDEYFGSSNTEDESDPYSGFEPTPTGTDDAELYAELPERQNATLDEEDMKSSVFGSPPGDYYEHGDGGAEENTEGEGEHQSRGTSRNKGNDDDDDSDSRGQSKSESLKESKASSRNSRRQSDGNSSRINSRRESHVTNMTEKSDAGSRRGSAADADDEITDGGDLAPLDDRKLLHVQRRRIISKETSKEVERDIQSAEDRMSRLSMNDKSGKSSRKSSMKSDRDSGEKSNSERDSGRSSGSEPITENDRRRESTRSDLTESEVGHRGGSSKTPSRASGGYSDNMPDFPATQRRTRLSERRPTDASSMLHETHEVEEIVVEADVHAQDEGTGRRRGSSKQGRNNARRTDSGISLQA